MIKYLLILLFPTYLFSQTANIANHNLISLLNEIDADTFVYESKYPPTFFQFNDINAFYLEPLKIKVLENNWQIHTYLLGKTIKAEMNIELLGLGGFEFVRNIGSGGSVCLEFKKGRKYKYFHWSNTPTQVTIQNENFPSNINVNVQTYKRKFLSNRYVKV